MGTPARLVLLFGTTLVVWAWLHARALMVVRDGWHGRPHDAAGVIEGRLALDELRPLLKRPDVPRVEVCANVPWGFTTTEVEENGRFVLSGLPMQPVDLDIRIAGQRLALVEQVQPARPDLDIRRTTLADPRLDGIQLAGPVHLVELAVHTAQGRRVEGGHLAWRPVGEDDFRATVEVREGRATIVSLVPYVDVQPLVPGWFGEVRTCVGSGELVQLFEGARLRAPSGELPEGVLLRLELTQATPAGALTGEAALRARETVGGYASDGSAEIVLCSPGAYEVSWAVYAVVMGRLSRLREVSCEVRHIDVTGPGTIELDLPLPQDLAAARARYLAAEGLGGR